eukprot:13304626-Ditylum_brightwellii.AAC.1
MLLILDDKIFYMPVGCYMPCIVPDAVLPDMLLLSPLAPVLLVYAGSSIANPECPCAPLCILYMAVSLTVVHPVSSLGPRVIPGWVLARATEYDTATHFDENNYSD